MRTIKLNTLLMFLVIIAGTSAMCVSAVIALYQSDRDSRAHSLHIAQVVKSQLEWQLVKVRNNFQSVDKFPDFYLWKKSDDFSGLCVVYEGAAGNIERSLCLDDRSEEIWPAWFEYVYLELLKPGKEVRLAVEGKGKVVGYVKVSPNVMVMLHHSWSAILNLMEFSAIVVIILCLLLYMCMHWGLKPARLARTVLSQMEKGDLSIRLPHFTIHEWQETGQSINKMASTLQENLDEQKRLSLKLLDLQENERRYLCRELHDELGQSLTGLRAVAYFMEEEIEERCPELSTKVNQITLISEHMMELVKSLLFRLRPADLDELGFTENLNSMIDSWNAKHQDKRCSLRVEGPCDEIPAFMAVNLLRTIQECLTNVVKHASARKAEVYCYYSRSPESAILLRVQDDGNFTKADKLEKPGNGLLGIRERVCALNGKLSLTQSELGGLKVEVIIPVTSLTEVEEINEYPIG